MSGNIHQHSIVHNMHLHVVRAFYKIVLTNFLYSKLNKNGILAPPIFSSFVALKLALKEEEKINMREKGRSPGIILRIYRNMVLTEKIHEHGLPSLAGRHHPLCSGPQPEGRAGRNLGADGTQRENFLTKSNIPRRIKLGTSMLLGSLNLSNLSYCTAC
jgi:hypothetical protein